MWRVAQGQGWNERVFARSLGWSKQRVQRRLKTLTTREFNLEPEVEEAEFVSE